MTFLIIDGRSPGLDRGRREFFCNGSKKKNRKKNLFFPQKSLRDINISVLSVLSVYLLSKVSVSSNISSK